MKRICLIVLLALPAAASAQSTPQQSPVAITLSPQEQAALEGTALGCLERTPGQCAEYVMYFRAKIAQARSGSVVAPPAEQATVYVDPDKTER